MRKIILIVLAFLLGTPAFADWTGKNAAGATITFSNSVDCTSGTCIPIAALVNAAGATLYGTAGTANAGVLTIQGIASMTKLLVTPDSVALPANQSVNVSQINSVTPLMGNGATGTGSPRVTISNDNTLPTGWPTATDVKTVNTWATGTLGAMANYGTSPGAVLVPSVNAFITNTNANGQVTMANSSPVVIASNQTAVPISAASASIASGAVASGAIASGAFASGSIGSGAIASGAVASGAYASGSLASGAVVDLTNMSATLAAAPPAKALQVGANTSGATGGLIQGLIQCDSTAIYDASTSGSTELVALTSGRTIYVCGYTIMAGGTVNVKLIYGTGTACATGSNNMTPAFQLTAQAGLVDGAAFSRGLKTASANALCINTSAGIAAQAIVYYAKL